MFDFNGVDSMGSVDFFFDLDFFAEDDGVDLVDSGAGDAKIDFFDGDLGVSKLF